MGAGLLNPALITFSYLRFGESKASMIVTERKNRVTALADERRRFRRVAVNLLGRYMLADRREFPCQITDMSPGGMALIAPVAPRAGERVVAYVDHLGRLEGTVARQFQNGFAMRIDATTRKRDKLAAQLTWLANRDLVGLPEDRQSDRLVPRNPDTSVVLPSGVSVSVKIIDLSLSGAGVSGATKPAIGAMVTLGKIQGRVIRHTESGFAIEFTRLQHPDFIDENVSEP